MKYILGEKVKMDQVWRGDAVIPVTVIRARPNTVSLVRTKERDGYSAVQVQLGRHRREVRLETMSDLEVGDTVDVTSFREGEKVVISGTSKGRGFQGVVKRHGFSGGPRSHGQKDRHRAPGSIGATGPQRVPKGRKMAGRMGNERITIKNMEVIGVDVAKHLILVKGAVPGMRGTLVEVRSTRHEIREKHEEQKPEQPER